MKHSKYLPFQLQDFLDDDFFVQWVVSPDDNSISFWQSFIETYPDKKDLIEKASGIIRSYREQQFIKDEAQKNKVWQRIQHSVSDAPVQRTFRLPSYLKVAAAILIVVVSSFILIYKYNGSDNNPIVYNTGFGEKKTITLPDQSEVTLNANSSITYNPHPQANTPREVWVDGEAYFTIKHINKDTSKIAPGERFIVHCGDLNIEVLGTTFNVKARHGKTDVALITGKIRIDYNDESRRNTTVIMAPGDYVEYAAKKIVTTKKLIKPEQAKAWTSNEISFTDASLEEITETLQDRFGYTVNTNDTMLLKLKIEGEISVNDVAELLDVVTTTLNVKIEQSANKHITISK